MEREAVYRFVEAWRSMADLFGFNPSTARVSALLMVTGETLSLGEIAELLQISRGNASMCLKELRAWGVVRQLQRPGDRRDFYTSEPDLWRLFVAIARERKRREFDPALADALAALEALRSSELETPTERLGEIEEFLTSLDRIGRQFLENQDAALALIRLLRRIPAEGEDAT